MTDQAKDAGRAGPEVALDPAMVRALLERFKRVMMTYRFGIDAVMTKINILRDEFRSSHEYNPIEHVSSRLKSPQSIFAKAERKGFDLTLDALRTQMLDVAGVRVTCSFVSDIYRLRDMLAGQQDVVVLEERDYIANPKPNGYKSLHLIVEVPVYMSDRVEPVVVEIQIRTIAMDFWASLEHKIYYKYDKTVPDRLVAELKEAADAAAALDAKMERLHGEVRLLENGTDEAPEVALPEPTREALESYLRAVRLAPETIARGLAAGD